MEILKQKMKLNNNLRQKSENQEKLKIIIVNAKVYGKISCIKRNKNCNELCICTDQCKNQVIFIVIQRSIECLCYICIAFFKNSIQKLILYNIDTT